MNGHCMHPWERHRRSIAIWMLIAGIFGREIVRFAKWSLLASLGERSLDYKMVIVCTFGVHRASDTYIRCLRKVMMVSLCFWKQINLYFLERVIKYVGCHNWWFLFSLPFRAVAIFNLKDWLMKKRKKKMRWFCHSSSSSPSSFIMRFIFLRKQLMNYLFIVLRKSSSFFICKSAGSLHAAW